jgi:hypothetical protein
MWSYYAKDHSGIGIEFHIGNELFLKALPVNYEADYPILTIEKMYEQAHKIMLTKADCWNYEEEFRLIASPELPIDNPLRVHDDYFIRLPARAILRRSGLGLLR